MFVKSVEEISKNPEDFPGTSEELLIESDEILRQLDAFVNSEQFLAKSNGIDAKLDEVFVKSEENAGKLEAFVKCDRFLATDEFPNVADSPTVPWLILVTIAIVIKITSKVVPSNVVSIQTRFGAEKLYKRSSIGESIFGSTFRH